MNPATTPYLAHEASQTEIDDTFRHLPWCAILVLVGGKEWTRKDWKEDRLRMTEEELQRKAEAEAAKNGLYHVT